MTVKELIEMLKTCDEEIVIVNANGLYVILKASSNRAGFVQDSG